MRPGNFLGAAVICAALLAITFVASVTQDSNPEMAATTVTVVR
ncbi:hypothetical protein [Endobacterium cereale]|nr:hypothetical protein [Endobacterium cereale]MEB2846115.1 hypothetical protein [Endobacterium cereale]